MVGASGKDYDLLVENRFILVMGHLAIIKHWRMHNTISQNRYHGTQYTEEKGMLLLKENGAYSLNSGVPLNDEKPREEKKESPKKKKTACKRLTSGLQTACRYSENDALNTAFTDYVEMRKQIKKPMTDKAVELAKSKLEKLSRGNVEVAIAILNQSVLNSWQGLFELKEGSVANGCVGNNGTKVAGAKDEYADEFERALSGV